MRLPVAVTRTIDISTQEDLSGKMWRERFVKETANQLTKRNAQAVTIEGDRVGFLGPFALFASAYNLLTPITSGWIEVQARGTNAIIQYRLSFRRVFCFAIAAAGFIVFAFRASGLPMTSALVCVAFAWFWIFLVNVVFRLWYFGRLMSIIFDRTVYDSVRPDSRNFYY